MKRLGLRGTCACPVDLRLAVHLAAEAELGVFLGPHDAGLALPQEASTSWVVFPIEDTMPIPVTTTRLIFSSF